MKQTTYKWQAFLVAGAMAGMTMVGCNQSSQTSQTSQVPNEVQQEETSPATPGVTVEASETSIYNNAYENYNNLTDLGVIINSPKEEDLTRLNTLEEYHYDKSTNESMLIIPKYNGTKITVSSVEYTGERYVTKDVLYTVDATPEGYGLMIKANRPEGIAQIAVYITYKEKTVEYIIEATNGKDGNSNYEYLKVETEDKRVNQGDLITPEANADTYLEGLTCFKRYQIDIDKDGESEWVEVYWQGNMDANGEYLFDDGQNWALVLRKGDEIYPLFEKSYIQLGGLEYVIYEDYDDYNRTHILVTYNTGAAVMYYDCTYDEESGYIRRNSLYEASNINKIDEWSYKNCD